MASWQPWSPADVEVRLRAVTAPWYIAAGWALDLFRGGQSREHEDIEIGLPATPEAFGEVRAALAGCEHERIVLPYDRVIRRDPQGIPYLAPHAPAGRDDMATTWQWTLRPDRGGLGTRLVARQRFSYPPGQSLLWHLVEPTSLVMERRMLAGISARAEARAARGVARTITS